MALTQISTAGVKDDIITAAKIADDAVTSALIADDSITSALIADDAITSALIADDSITSALIADDAITSALIADDAVTSALIADDAVVQAAVADEAIDEARLQISNAGSNGEFLSKQSGNTGGLTWAAVPAGVGGATAVGFNDNVKISLGTGNDSEFYFSGTDNYFNLKSGKTFIRTGDEIRIQNDAETETIAKFIKDGACELYHNNGKKFETGSYGAAVTGYLQVGVGESINGLLANDDIRLRLGNDQDLDIYHDGTSNLIRNGGTADMYINLNTTEVAAKFTCNGAVELYYDNALSFSTTAAGLAFNDATDSQEIWFSDSNDADAGKILYDHTDDSMRFHVWGSERIRFHSTGDLTVGTDNYGTSLAQAGTVLNAHGGVTVRRNGNMSYWKTLDTGGYNSHVFLSANTTVGTIVVGSGGTTYNTSSDYRLKENQVAISDGITRLKTLKPYRFNFKNNPSKTVDGFFAHEVTAVPEAITGTKDAVEAEDFDETGAKKGDPIYQQIDQSKLVPLLTAALQEAIAKIETLETKVAALESA